MRQVAVVMQQLGYGEEEQPQAQHRGEDAQDEDSGHSLVPAPGTAGCGIALADGIRANPSVGCRTQPDARAEGRHEQQGDTDENAGVKQSG